MIELKFLKKLFIVIIIAFAAIGHTDGNNLKIEKLAIETNLPEGAVNCMVQDSTGFIWIGTWKGLYRYDGYNAINFSAINSEFNALKIGELHIHGNDLWVGTFVSGLFKINLLTYQITRYHSSSEKCFQIPDNNIISIMVMPDNTAFVGSERGGMLIISPDGCVSKIYDLEQNPEVLLNNQVTKILPFNSEQVIIGNYGLLLFNKNTESVRQIKHPLLETYISDIIEIKPLTYLLTTLEKLLIVELNNQNVQVKLLLDQRVNAIEKNGNDYLLATNNDVYVFNAKSQTIDDFHSHDIIKQSKLKINCFLTTHDEALLSGTESGLYSIFGRSQQFKHIESDRENESSDIISSIEKWNGLFLAGNWGEGLMKLDHKTQTLVPLKFKNHNSPSPRFIFAMKTINESLWFSAKNELGIFKIENESEPFQLKHYQSFKSLNNEYGTYTVTCIVNNNQSIMVGTWEGLLFIYNPLTDEFEIIKDRNGQLPSSRDMSIFSILDDKNGYTWVALSGGGVIKMKIDNNTIVSQEIISSQNGLTNNFTTTIFQSRNQKIWIGTEAGLSVYTNGECENLYDKDIVFDIQSIVEDPIGFLWIGTQKGLVRINSNNTDEPYKHFDVSDGLKNKSFYLNSYYVDKEYNTYFGGYNGIDFFMPYKIEFNYKKSTPKLTNFQLFNENTFPNITNGASPLEQNITTTTSIRLKHNQNTFSFEFSNLEYQNQDKCQFAYKLEGVDLDWNYRDAKQRIAYYTKLSPGTYTFHLKSTNNDGLWSDEKVKLTISILPPIWASTLAYIVYFVGAMFSIFGFIFFQMMKVQEKHHQKLKEVEHEKQKELDELKLRFFTNISHEFRTPLTLILGPLARLLENERNNPYKETHLMIFRNASRLLQLTNRILDFRKNEKDQLKLKVQPTDISNFFYNIFLFFNYEAQKRNIDYRFKTNYEGILMIDREFIESVAFNLLSNAFKYTPNDKSITVTVDQWRNGVKITFSDTGPGIKDSDKALVFDRFYSTTKRNSAGIGLSFSKRLIELHKGEITIESIYGEGTTFAIILPPDSVYSNEEKQTIENKEIVADWKKIDQTVQETLTSKTTDLKILFKKNEMIALLVDDNFEIRQFLRSLLENEFKIIEASNGKEAIELALKHIPDIIISDVMMPLVDGYELCNTLKSDERTDHIPIILTTVLSSQEDRNTGLLKGADSYIPKPIDPNHLMIRVNKLIEKQLKLKKKFKFDNYTTSREEFETDKPEVHPLVEKAHNIVLKNLDNSDYNIDNFCNDLGLSRMQLYRKFKAITGLSANSFIRKVRIHKAAEMLLTGNYSVKEVTYDVGFIDLKYFRKCFFDEFGSNPSDYAQAHAKTRPI
ncbi:MAG TPA: ATP-binding protein [Prolixibacteraceae bacterium]|nr:ATP-binding protein [Prolixibacteraceae bacterium]